MECIIIEMVIFMEFKVNYNECLVNLANSIRKYYGLKTHHSTLAYIDEILEERKPETVILFLFDGMGSRMLERIMPEDSYFRKHMIKEITSVYPPTTTAATTSVRTGMTPMEHGFMGWDTYIKELDKTITLFLYGEKGGKAPLPEYQELRKTFEPRKLAVEIREETEYFGCEITPFDDYTYKTLDECFEMIKHHAKKEGKKFIYAYDTEPDSSMHRNGVYNPKIKEILENREQRIQDLVNELENTIVFVVADHGLINIENIHLSDYPILVNMLERTPSLEQRSTSFKVKEEYKEEFKIEFNKYLGQYFTLLSKQEVLDLKLFGEGNANDNFEYAIGDYISIATTSNKALISENDWPLASQHAGLFDDEIYVPLIMIDKTK